MEKQTGRAKQKFLEVQEPRGAGSLLLNDSNGGEYQETDSTDLSVYRPPLPGGKRFLAAGGKKNKRL